MKRLRMFATCLIAMLATAAVTAAGASAEAPEVGRCVEVAPKTGKYTSDLCTKLAKPTKLGNFEWEAGAIKKKFTGKSSGASTLETVAGVKTTCTNETASGEFSGTKTVGNVRVTFTGCEGFGFKCTSTGAGAGEIVVNTLDGELVWEKKPKKVAIELFPAPPNELFTEFNCGGLKAKVKGAVLANIPADKAELMVTQKFTAKKGVQKPTEYEKANGEKVKAVLYAKLSESEAAAFEQAGQTTTNVQTDEEVLEVNTVA